MLASSSTVNVSKSFDVGRSGLSSDLEKTTFLLPKLLLNHKIFLTLDVTEVRAVIYPSRHPTFRAVGLQPCVVSEISFTSPSGGFFHIPIKFVYIVM